MKNGKKIVVLALLVQVAGLIYGIVNKAEDIIVMCLIFIVISSIELFEKKKNKKI